MAVLWYYKRMGQEVGPLSPCDLVQAVIDGLIVPETEVRQEPGDWMLASKVSGLFERAKQLTQTRASQGDMVESESDAIAPLSPFSATSNASTQLAAQSSEDVLQVMDVAKNHGFKVEVLAYRTLSGSHDPSTAQTIFFANQAGLRLKQVKITLHNSEAQIEAGALHFMHGRLEMENKSGGMAGIGKAMLNKMLTSEVAFKPRYRGTGELYLEPSFGHFLIYQLRNEELIADKGIFLCSEGQLNVGIAMQKNASSAFLGGEGFFQTKIQGDGICVFELPVPAKEVRCIQLKNETLQVDGNFAILRTGNIEFSVEKSTKSLFGTLASGEGFLQTFRGTGKVWLAPTKGIYQKMQMGGLGSLTAMPKSSSTTT
ncbi:AIM24 family protein [Leptolyngbya sp. AN02str]|uniref:AIM24 family protein n=1 Tax=Leptolyngbya sp. AN02str TaxID=3423363 RepID=UPI003D31C9A4